MRFERRLRPQINLDLTPLIDVVFQLVIFFMISSVFNTAPGIPLDLPEAGTAETVSVTELVISVVSEDEVYLNREPYTAAALGDVLRDKRDRGEIAEETMIIMKGGRDVSYQLMVRLLDALRLNGFRQVNLVTDQPDEE